MLASANQPVSTACSCTSSFSHAPSPSAISSTPFGLSPTFPSRSAGPPLVVARRRPARSTRSSSPLTTNPLPLPLVPRPTTRSGFPTITSSVPRHGESRAVVAPRAALGRPSKALARAHQTPFQNRYLLLLSGGLKVGLEHDCYAWPPDGVRIFTQGKKLDME